MFEHLLDFSPNLSINMIHEFCTHYSCASHTQSCCQQTPRTASFADQMVLARKLWLDMGSQRLLPLLILPRIVVQNACYGHTLICTVFKCVNVCVCVFALPSPSRVLWGQTRPCRTLSGTSSLPTTIRSTSSTRGSSKRWSRGWRSGQCPCFIPFRKPKCLPHFHFYL